MNHGVTEKTNRSATSPLLLPFNVAFLTLCLCSSLIAAEPAITFLPKAPPAEQTNAPAIQCWSETRTAPRPMVIHMLKVALKDPRVEIVAAIAPDPDGKGPAESQLILPQQLAASNLLVAAVNANAFKSLPDAAGKESKEWFDRMPVDIISWAASGGKTISSAKHRYPGVWIDARGDAGIGEDAGGAAVREAAAGFEQILKDDAIVCGTNGALHPRTAVGLDRAGHFIWLATVDGRQNGYSEGMTTFELAELMRAAGCWNALNLDGGGSTIMMAEVDGHLQVLNRPSDRDRLGRVALRPVPVLLGIRLRR